MKKQFLILVVALVNISLSYAQNSSKYYFKTPSEQTVLSNKIANTEVIKKEDLPIVFVNENTNVMFRLPESAQFIDLSGENLIGDIPVSNVVRVKINRVKVDSEESAKEEQEITKRNFERISNPRLPMLYKKKEPYKYFDKEEIGIITITAESFMAQYRVLYTSPNDSEIITTNIEVLPEDMFPLEYPKYDLNKTELHYFSIQSLKQKKNKIQSASSSKMKLTVNNVFIVGDFFFVDISIKNRTNISYDISDIKFSINDKHIYKATNTQSLDIEPYYVLYKDYKVHNKYRNIFVFRKFTLQNRKVFNIRLLEEQLSGRTVEVNLKYKDILSADKL